MMIGEKYYSNQTVHVAPWPYRDDLTVDVHSALITSNGNGNSNDDFSSLQNDAALKALMRYLPSNSNDVVFESDNERDVDLPVGAYSSDNFRMYDFKVRRCARGRSHDWTECQYAHPGEKARRRDPRKFHYSGTACPEFRKGSCRKGDACEYAHGVFECWLHPARYRTQPCKDGLSCRRRVCFFAHAPEQLRVLSPRAESPHWYNSYDGSCESGSPPTESPPLSPSVNSLSRSHGSNSVNGLVASMRQIQLNKVNSMPSSLASTTNVAVPMESSNTTVCSFITQQRAWDVAALSNILPPSTINDIRAIPLSIHPNQVDSLTWPHSNSGQISVSSAFAFVSGHKGLEDSHGWIWKVPCVERVKIFLWKIVADGLLTNSERRRRGLSDNANCPRCGVEEETLDHLFRRCDFATQCWELAAPPGRFWSSFHLPLTTWLENFSSTSQQRNQDGHWMILFPYMLWNIWKARNLLVFNHSFSTTADTVQKAGKETMESHRYLLKRSGPLHASQLWISWLPPQAGYVKMNSDGARRASSGLASAGGLIRDSRGNWLVGFTTNIGHTSSFNAELWGFREGLTIAKGHGFTHIFAETDSEAMVKTLHNDTGTSLFDSTLVADCKSLIRQFQDVKISHVYREGNKCADFLANMGQDSNWGTTLLDHPPAEIQELLSYDKHSIATCRRR